MMNVKKILKLQEKNPLHKHTEHFIFGVSFIKHFKDV